MISPVEFLSYDHRPADFSPQGTEFEGPPFDEYLARAEMDMGSSPAQTEAYKADADLQAGSSHKAEGSKDGEAAAVQSKKRETDTPKSNETVRKDDSDEGTDESIAEDKNEQHSNIVSTRAGDKQHSQKNSLKADNPEGVIRLVRAAGENNESGVRSRVETKAEVGEKAEKSASSGRIEDAADSDEDPKNPTLKSMNLSDGGIARGDAENAEKSGNLPAEKSPHNDEAYRNSSNIRRVHSREDTDRQAVKAELIDLRSRKETKTEQEIPQSAQKVEGGSIQESLKPEGQSRQEFIVIEAAQGKADGNVSRGDAGPSQAAADLSRALKDEGNGEIIKKAQFLLKDRDQGEIRLILKPEKLGEVRIRLNLSDNRHIAGRIIVENNSVREVFQENMEALNRTFRENGFQTAGLDVSVGQREGFSGKRREQNLEGLPVEKLTRIFDEQVPRVEDFIFGESRVNVYV